MNKETVKLSKSERTQAKILAAARDLFGERGYEGASVRDIAAAADIDPAMVIRYFGSKDGLFAQAAEIDLRLPDLAGVPHEHLGETLVRHFLDIWEAESSAKGLVILLRSAASNAYAAERSREIFVSQVLPALARARAGADASARAGRVSSQLLGLALGRYVLRLPPLTEMSQATIVQQVGRTIQGYLEN
jgi:AcrR family transcriptional regulator